MGKPSPKLRSSILKNGLTIKRHNSTGSLATSSILQHFSTLTREDKSRKYAGTLIS